MRRDVQKLLKLGPFPAEETVAIEVVEEYEKLLHIIEPPITSLEANGLLLLFGPDSFFGLAWTLISLIESAEGWPDEICLPDSENEWIKILNIRSNKLK